MANVNLGVKEVIDKVKINHIVDEKTTIIGKNTSQSERVSKSQAKQMLEQTLDTTNDPATKAAYEKIYRGVSRET